jgi:hypothetical protein
VAGAAFQGEQYLQRQGQHFKENNTCSGRGSCISRRTILAVAGAAHGEQYLQWQGQLMTQPAAMKSSSVGPALTAAFACTGTAAVGVAGTDALSAPALGGAGAAETSSNGCWLVAPVRGAPVSLELTLDMAGMG